MYIHRKNESYLVNWRLKRGRKPLIIRGARQTGKTRLVEEFGNRHYKHLVEINFEKEPQYKSLFKKGGDVEDIVRQIEIMKDKPVLPGETLLFLDEIQECPSAIKLLRYFYEDLSDYHVIAAGSLLEFALAKEDISFPVGRVEFLYHYPLSFNEFLRGLSEDKLTDIVNSSTIDEFKKIGELVHEKLRMRMRDYLIVGGLPEVVVKYIEERGFRACEEVWESLIETFRDDFRKYGVRVNTDNIDFLFRTVPQNVGKQVNYTKLGGGEIRAREISIAFSLLQKAMILYRVQQVSSIALPLIPKFKTHPKVIFLDVGLVQYINRISPEILQANNFSTVYQGGLAEQFVGQQLLAMLGEHRRPELFYWQREKRGSSAEVDYLIPWGAKSFPVEVKWGKGSRLASLHQFMYQYRYDLAIRVYDGPFRMEEVFLKLPQMEKQHSYKLLSLPLYLTEQIPRLIEGLE